MSADRKARVRVAVAMKRLARGEPGVWRKGESDVDLTPQPCAGKRLNNGTSSTFAPR
jgi:hypothetical protein